MRKLFEHLLIMNDPVHRAALVKALGKIRQSLKFVGGTILRCPRPLRRSTEHLTFYHPGILTTKTRDGVDSSSRVLLFQNFLRLRRVRLRPTIDKNERINRAFELDGGYAPLACRSDKRAISVCITPSRVSREVSRALMLAASSRVIAT